MIAIVYSGSRYATWKLAEKSTVVSEFKTAGINPFFHDDRFITQLLNRNNELVTHAEKIKKIYFFGAGASSAERRKLIVDSFSKFFRFGKVSVEHDMKAAALATCGDNPGIVGILGSGSNAAYYTGKAVKENNNGLGYVLNDEGSANWLGRVLLKNFLNNTLPEPLKKKFIKKFGLERRQILDKVYKQAQPILFLTSFSEFFLENRSDAYVEHTVKQGFSLYFENYIVPLCNEYPGLPVHFTGTVASGFDDWIRETAEQHLIPVSSIVRTPINYVLDYYTTKN